MPITSKTPYDVSMEPIAQKIREQGRKKGLTGRRLARYTYGGLNNLGAKRGNVTTRKGAAMVAEHRAGVRGQLRKYEQRGSKRHTGRPGGGRHGRR